MSEAWKRKRKNYAYLKKSTPSATKAPAGDFEKRITARRVGSHRERELEKAGGERGERDGRVCKFMPTIFPGEVGECNGTEVCFL